MLSLLMHSLVVYVYNVSEGVEMTVIYMKCCRIYLLYFALKDLRTKIGEYIGEIWL